MTTSSAALILRMMGCALPLVPGHCDMEALLRADQVVQIFGRLVEIDLSPQCAAGKGAITLASNHSRGVPPSVPTSALTI